MADTEDSTLQSATERLSVVVGGASGIGAATAEVLADRGDDVVIADRARGGVLRGPPQAPRSRRQAPRTPESGFPKDPLTLNHETH